MAGQLKKMVTKWHIYIFYTSVCVRAHAQMCANIHVHTHDQVENDTELRWMDTHRQIWNLSSEYALLYILISQHISMVTIGSTSQHDA
jgi:hypothetical protein